MGQFSCILSINMSAVLLVLVIFACSAPFSSAGQCILDGNSISCKNLRDGELPGAVESISGSFEALRIYDSPDLTMITPNSFPELSFETIIISGNENLQKIFGNFLPGGEASVTNMYIQGYQNLRFFPFYDMYKFKNLKFLQLDSLGIETIPSEIEWPSSLTTIEGRYLTNLTSIEPYAFSKAQNLQSIWVGEVGPNCVVKSNGFHTTTSAKKSLIIYPYKNGKLDECIILEDNAFGNVDGGQLWDQLNLGCSDFNENAMRLLFKAHFDKQHPTFWVNIAAAGWIKSCDDCEIAWLYKDAQQFGFNAYKRLVGESNAICPDVGPIFETDDGDFIAQINDCPYTPMPWPGDNYCKDVTDPLQNVVADPEDCHCFYNCAGSQVQGHECCAPGLAFNPSLLNCDWAYNVENCE